LDEYRVQLGVTHTELGTLKIQCVEANSTNTPPLRWDVEFEIRKSRRVPLSLNEANLPPQTGSAIEAIALVFGPKSKAVDPNAVKNLRHDLDKIIGLERSQWSTALLRALFDALWDGHTYRRRSPAHERVWLGLTGFCLRPGFGAALDGWRMEQLWKLYPQGLQFIQESQNWSEWWTLWRRVAGGLDTKAQTEIFEDVAKYLNPAALRQPAVVKQAKQRSVDEVIRLVGTLERLETTNKIQLGGWLIKRMEKSSESGQIGWALGRAGARMPFYGEVQTVVPAETANQWLDVLLSLDWKKIPQSAFAVALIARNSGDRVRDINPSVRARVIAKLNAAKSPVTWIEMVEHYQELDASTESQFLGETLPPGLQLMHHDK
jgi:hypothetical protein